MAMRAAVLLFETTSAKEAKSRLACGGKRLGCLYRADRGLQCGLSGSPVAGFGNVRQGALMGNRQIGEEW